MTVFVMVLAALFVHSSLGAQESDATDRRLEELAPTATEATVAPVQAAVRDMPPLPPVPVDTEALEIVLPTEIEPPQEIAQPEIPRDAVTPVAMLPGEDQVYFNATLGGGSVNSILGSINVYRLGDGPQFRVGYDHRGRDGFNFEKQGSGFFEEINDLSTWLRLGGDGDLSLEVDATYRDERFGLQLASPYYSQDVRVLSGRIAGAYSPESVLDIRGTVDMSNALRVLATGDSGVDAVRNEYARITPRLSARLEWPRFAVEVAGGYDGVFPSRMELADTAVFDGQIGIETVPVDGLTLAVRGESQYRLRDGVYFPVDGAISYRGDERWYIDLSGGYEVRENDPTTLWGVYPATSITVGDDIETRRLPAQQRVFVAGELGVFLIPRVLEIRGGGERSLITDRLEVEPYETTSSRYPYTVENAELLTSDLAATLTVSDGVSLDGGWEAQWDDRLPGVPAHVATAGIIAAIGDLTLEGNGRFPLERDGDLFPEVDFEARYEIARDVEFRLYALDILAPAMEDGRSLRGVAPDDNDPFIAPGLEVGAAVRVSF